MFRPCWLIIGHAQSRISSFGPNFGCFVSLSPGAFLCCDFFLLDSSKNIKLQIEFHVPNRPVIQSTGEDRTGPTDRPTIPRETHPMTDFFLSGDLCSTLLKIDWGSLTNTSAYIHIHMHTHRALRTVVYPKMKRIQRVSSVVSLYGLLIYPSDVLDEQSRPYFVTNIWNLHI